MGKTQQIAFRPKARLVAILGEHLISDQAVGLIELVKNSYDADARKVTVEIRDTAKPEKTRVAIQDDGFGMSMDDIRDRWLSPADDHKERSKLARKMTPGGRIAIGEKGVGRFAAHQIGRALEMVTRARGQPEVLLSVNWDKFEGQAFLDGVSVDVTERDPLVFKGDRTGTRMVITIPRAPWTEKLLKKVHRTLRRLQSPIQEKKQRFRIEFHCPEHPELGNIDSTDILEKAHYTYRAFVDESGRCDFEYACRHPSVTHRKRNGKEDLSGLAKGELQGDRPQCGRFHVNFYVWDRTRDHLSRAGVSADELDSHCGVSVFRDGLRVLPYGEPGDDWLLLDQERIQAPSERVGNNQIIGLVEVDQSENLELRDKTNREGLIENAAFLDLRTMVRAAVRHFTSYWRGDRPERPETKPKDEQGLYAAKAIAHAIQKTARPDVNVEIAPAPNKNGDHANRVTVAQPEALRLLTKALEGAEETVREKERHIETLLQLAGTGLAAERVVHEFGRQVRAATQAVSDLKAAQTTAARARAAEVVDTCLQTLRNEFRVLAPYEVVERSQKAARVSLRDAAELAVSLNQEAITNGEIEVAIRGRDFKINARPASVVQILDNLTHNAVHWVTAAKRVRNHRVLVQLDAARRQILVADNGPGIPKESEGHLFQPFFTTKVKGKGLGLFISAELARGMKGTLALADVGQRRRAPGWAKGAVFVLTLPDA